MADGLGAVAPPTHARGLPGARRRGCAQRLRSRHWRLAGPRYGASCSASERRSSWRPTLGVWSSFPEPVAAAGSRGASLAVSDDWLIAFAVRGCVLRACSRLEIAGGALAVHFDDEDVPIPV